MFLIQFQAAPDMSAASATMAYEAVTQICQGQSECIAVGDNKYRIETISEADRIEVKQIANVEAPSSVFIPKTPLAKKLFEIRQRAIASGYVMRPAAQIISEIRESRS